MRDRHLICSLPSYHNTTPQHDLECGRGEEGPELCVQAGSSVDARSQSFTGEAGGQRPR